MKKSYSQPLRSTGRPQSRRVGIERLESRSLLAGDLFHNFVTPEDADGSGSIDPLDALVVVNQLNQSLNWTTGATSTDGLTRFVDVDADDVLTPLDALVVINHINSIPSDRIHGLRVSDVDVDRRVGKIEWAIANQVLPPNITMDDAECVLATLRSGGRPELGDRVLDGQLQWKQDVFPGVGDPTKDRGGDPTSGGDMPQVDRWINAVSKRLSAFGVATHVITKLSSEIEQAAQDGSPMSLDAIGRRLSELGVDVAAVFPQLNHSVKPDLPDLPDRPEQPDNPIMPAIMVTEPIAESILARLKNASVDEKVIEILSREIWDAIRAETPMDLLKVRERLEELGVDWETLGPPPSNTAVRHPVVEWSDLLEKLQPLMGRLSIKREVLATISREVRDAASNGKPMDSEQIIDRLSALGVPVRGIQFTV
jgi:hypothetical protein